MLDALCISLVVVILVVFVQMANTLSGNRKT